MDDSSCANSIGKMVWSGLSAEVVLMKYRLQNSRTAEWQQEPSKTTTYCDSEELEKSEAFSLAGRVP